mmetsp:Transcript_20885/g.25648  ORF Transcript_20885/g.25648 Transcript_20885/m.25648 type:complete len:308 (-) Transcript_20885:184-1107(-)|eukprot:CAMPEP_0170465414 /NCGR_PEP_ID=MMETSP0123-20130129/9765_1 /TAXON_ID=182087 /ORGANISM="Favella ehrenbergii, Strain Fehren 1" /LENGTH=307 /DNA_ID=CAMNT_0010731301 /DNA_START=11 /DNA_END=934 /DNA_ORIENTATION=+
MELVVVNGANNIARSVIRGLTATGKYSRVRMLDFRPYKEAVYAFQRELGSQNVQLNKHLVSNLGSLEIGMEGADEVVYFTHDYFSLTSCKNNTLVAAADIAKKLGVSKMVAVCPVEHDMAMSDDADSWIEKRQEAEQKALDKNSKMSVLSSDLVFGKDPTHLVHYMHQCALAGKIQGPILSDDAKFKPVHHADLTRAIERSMSAGLTGQFAVRGTEEVTSRQLLNLVEKSCGVEPGNTRARFETPVFPVARMMEEFLVGMAADTNMAEMIQYFSENQDAPVSGQDIWQATGSEPEEALSQFFKYHRV